MFCSVNATGCGVQIRPGPIADPMPWPAYLGSPRHDISAAESLRAEPQVLWTTPAGRAVRGSPAIGSHVIAVGVPDRMLVLVDRASGDVFWRARLSGTVHGGPLLAGDKLFVATEETPEGRVYAVNLRDGKILWRRRSGSVVAPLASDSFALYAGLERGSVWALDPKTGELKWRRPLPGAVRAGPVPTPHGIVVATTADSLYLLDRATGGIIRSRGTRGTVLGTPATDGNWLYMGTTAGWVIATSLPDLETVWDVAMPDQVLGAPALVNDTVYALSRDGTLARIPATEPTQAQQVGLGTVSIAGPTPTKAGVLVGTVAGEVLLVDPATGAVRWRARVDGPVEQPPLVRDGVLVVVGGRGDIHTYR